MYAHEVIDQVPMPEYIIKKIRSSQKFHMGEINDLERFTPKESVGEKLFIGKFGGVDVPYNISWFEWYDNDTSNRTALLVTKDDKKYCIYGFRFIGPYPKWFGISHHLEMYNGLGSSYKIVHNINHNDIFDIKDIYKLKFKTPLFGLNLSLLLLSCKNIETENITPLDRMPKKLKKSGAKQPLFTYKILVLKPYREKEKSIPRHLWNNRIHLARGHFKTYTEDHPLFGHIVGRFWWQPHVRGKNKSGVVMKDYHVSISN